MKQTTANIWTVVLLALLFLGMIGLSAYAMWGGPKKDEEKDEQDSKAIEGDSVPDRS